MERSFIVRYQEPIKFTEEQLKVFWLPDELKVEKDLPDFKTKMTAAEQHAVSTTLKLFSAYEVYAGIDYWLGKVLPHYKNIPEICRMASTFGMFELAVHQPFYTKLNEVVGLHTEEFYSSYKEIEVLKNRMSFIDNLLEEDVSPVQLAVFSLIEGCVLYSSFAFLKHFQNNGKNLINTVVRGIDFSVRDENLHCLGGAWLYNLETSHFSDELKGHFEREVKEYANIIYEHECGIIDLMFANGSIEGITPIQLKHFVESRINLCLSHLGMSKLFEVKYNPIADWFYTSINSYKYNDFFSGVGNEYQRNWAESEFVW